MSFRGLLLLGGALVLLGAAAGATEESRRSLPAPRDPEKLPKPPQEPPPARRVHERRVTLKDENSVERSVACYSPADSLEYSAWVVTAWHVAERDEEVIRVAFNPRISSSDAEFGVRWGSTHNPDRYVFRRYAKTLWPDDKWNDRVIRRYSPAEENGCFLIDVGLPGAMIDFYHQSLRVPTRPDAPLKKKIILYRKGPIKPAPSTEVPVLINSTPPKSALVQQFDAFQAELAEIRKLRESLKTKTLDEKELRALNLFLDQRMRETSTKYLGNSGQQDLLAPDR